MSKTANGARGSDLRCQDAAVVPSHAGTASPRPARQPKAKLSFLHRVAALAPTLHRWFCGLRAGPWSTLAASPSPRIGG